MNKPLLILLPFIITGLLSCSDEVVDAPRNLTVSEGFVNPLGFYDANPDFSWKLPISDHVKSQSAYHIVVASDSKLLPNNADLWNSGKVITDQSVFIKYQGSELSSQQKVFWQVKFWDQDDNASEWSDLAHFELGLLNNSDWQAKWISLSAEEEPVKNEFGTLEIIPEYLRKEFSVSPNLAQVRLYVTSKGIFQAYINGEKVGDDVLTPGYTPYSARLETITYDITGMVNKGNNAIGILLGEGWFSGRLGWRENMWIEKSTPKILCQIEIVYKDGRKEVVLSDQNWKGSRNGPIRFSGYYDGEIYDARLEMHGWNSVGYNDNDWTGVETKDVSPDFLLTPKRHNTVKIKTQISTKTINEPSNGVYVFDLGQNMVGVPKLRIPVKKDQTVTIRFAEMVEKNGEIYTDNYRSAKSIDYYIPAQDGIVTWQPTFTFHGFRYVELSGIDESATPDNDWVTGLVYYSDFEKTGSFSTSNEKLNQLQSNIEWGMRGNFIDIPTDCPQRDERLGWTGDAQVFAPTSMFIGDVHAFWMSWLQSMREEQDEEGGIPFIVPNEMGKTFSSGWADAATVIPWEIYFHTGNKNVLKENYQMMNKLVDYYLKKSSGFIVDVNTFGDWLQPYPIEPENLRGDTPKDLIGTAYFARSVDLTRKAAEVLGKIDDAQKLDALFKNISTAFEQKYFDNSGKLTTEHESQTAYLMALKFDLVSDNIKAHVLENLLKQIKRADNHLRTGFLGTPLLASVLDDNGHAGLMYEILFKETYPSWFYSINQGATTMWERWNSYTHKDGFSDAGMNSFNHYAYGAIGQWMYERIAGIKPLEAGYKKILIAPLPGGKLTHAKAEYESVYGTIRSEWNSKNGLFRLHVTVPPNTTAIVTIPTISADKVTVNRLKISEHKNITILEINSENVIIDVPAGNYDFIAK